MPRIDESERRLENWARWKLEGSSGGLGYAKSDMASEGCGDRHREAMVPTGIDEAERTNRAILTLSLDVQRTVHAMYLEGGGKAKKARLLGVSEATIDSRIWLAHRRIETWFTEYEATKRVQRERDEAIQRTARP